MFAQLRSRLDRHLGSRLERDGSGAYPNRWSLLLGQVSVWSFVVLLVTGVYLVLFFEPSGRDVTYDGSYIPLRGVEMTAAYRSTIEISFDRQAGLLIRQTHHWAALVFVAAAVAHLARVFFSGAFRRPRRLNWIIGVTLLIIALAAGFTGYALPYDLLSGNGLRIAASILLAVPFVGTWMAFTLFGGEPPDPDVILRLYVLHVIALPIIVVGLMVVHLLLVRRQGPAQFPGPGRRESNVVGPPVRPAFVARSTALGSAVAAVLVALGGLVQISPIWLYGPFEPAAITSSVQPDWYLMWVEGALRTFGPWRVEALGHTLSEVFWPGVVLPVATFAGLYAWPFVAERLTGDRDHHHLLERARDHPARTAFGFGTATFYLVLTFAAGQDVVADLLGVSLPAMVWTFRILVIAAPPAAALLAHRVCRGLTDG